MLYFTTSDSPHPYRPDANGPMRHAWWFRADGDVIGVIEETEDGYRGRLFGPGGKDDAPRLRTGEASFRSSVIEHLTVQALILAGKERSADALKLDADDIKDVDTGRPTIEGMPAWDWIQGMTQR